MVASRASSLVYFLGIMLLAGCNSQGDEASKERLESMAGGELKETVPVSGKVLVDGAPQAGVNLQLYPQSGGRQPITTCRTGTDGTYCWSTNAACDGLAAGSYRLAFEFIPEEKKNDSGVDLFKGKYRNPATNKMELIVEKGKPMTDVNYELKTK
jgi:hypothetical protein